LDDRGYLPDNPAPLVGERLEALSVASTPRPRATRLAAVAGAALLLLASCGSSSAAGPQRAAAPPQAGDHDCVPAASGQPAVSWASLRNPILSYPRAGVKDQAIVWTGGRWHMLFSYVTNDPGAPGGVRWDIGAATSRDLTHWSAPSLWAPQPGGEASPDIVRSPSGLFVATYDSPPGESGPGQAKLFYRTSSDLVHWSAPNPLAPTLHPAPSDRLIDAALAWTGNGLILGYKVGTSSQAQAFEIAWSPSGSLGGPWTIVGRPDIVVDGGTVENYEFLTVGGTWRLVATSNNLDQPWIFSLAGSPSDPSAWLRWTNGYELRVPSQSWNSGPGLSSVGFEHANSAFLCNMRAVDGYYYLTYAGSSELTQFGGWGHAKIGIARSTDLVHWSVPG
jgi:hypothetical protein